LVAVVGGLVAFLPDVQLILEGDRGLWFRTLHDSVYADLFFLHRTFDRLDPNDGLFLPVVMILFAIIFTVSLIRIEG